jgi:murein L,D-transpeptidase YafK
VGKVELKKYDCVFGGNPIDDKKYEGDKCTPEGVFHIQAKYPHQDWNKFILIDYPTAQSWKKFEANKAHGKIPFGAQIGGSIGIHGVPAKKEYLIDKTINWTLGCISLRNADVDEIYRYVKVGTKVTIAK